jgi:hypothetical protein
VTVKDDANKTRVGKKKLMYTLKLVKYEVVLDILYILSLFSPTRLSIVHSEDSMCSYTAIILLTVNCLMGAPETRDSF